MPRGYNDYYGGAYLLNMNDATKPNDTLPKSDIPEIVIKDTFNAADAENLFPARRVRFTEPVDAKNANEADGEQPQPKKLNFPEFTNKVAESYHMVNGKKVHGLLVDPGASSGLMGTETLRELLSSGMVPQDKVKDIAWLPSTTTVTGISGQALLPEFRFLLVWDRMRLSIRLS
eukprot:s1483_g22.t1